MVETERLVCQFAEFTSSEIEKEATKAGIAIDHAFLEKCAAIAWAMGAIYKAERGESVNFQEQLANLAESISKKEKELAFCIQVFTIGKAKIKARDYSGALETLGFAHSLLGYTKRDDYRAMISAAGKHAVSFRPDQQLKPYWVNHVIACADRGVTINHIGDLLNEPGYDPQIANIAPATLKAWAKEAVPGLKFKSGRPK